MEASILVVAVPLLPRVSPAGPHSFLRPLLPGLVWHWDSLPQRRHYSSSIRGISCISTFLSLSEPPSGFASSRGLRSPEESFEFASRRGDSRSPESSNLGLIITSFIPLSFSCKVSLGQRKNLPKIFPYLLFFFHSSHFSFNQ